MSRRPESEKGNILSRIAIGVTQVGEAGITETGLVDGGILDLESDPVARADGPLAFSLRVEPAGKEWIVRGEVTAPLRLRCRRCAQFFSTNVSVPAFLHAYDRDRFPEILDVTEDVREDVILEIPGFPLCNEGCLGLCPQCGRNLNEGSCDCVPPEGAPLRWSALNGLETLLGPDALHGDGDCAKTEE